MKTKQKEINELIKYLETNSKISCHCGDKFRWDLLIDGKEFATHDDYNCGYGLRSGLMSGIERILDSIDDPIRLMKIVKLITKTVNSD